MQRLFRTGILAGLLVGSSLQAQQFPVVRIGTVVDGPWERNAELRALFEQELRDLLSTDFTVEFPVNAQITADWTLAGVEQALSQLFADTSIALIVTPGVMSSIAAALRDTHEKPIVAPFIPDAELLGVPASQGTSGVPNLVYVTHPSQVQRELEAFREVVPFERVAFLTNGSILTALPALDERLRQGLAAIDANITVIPVSAVNDQVLSSIPADVDAVVLAWLTNLQPGETQQLIDAMNARQLPSLAFFVEDVTRGAFMSLNGDSYFPRIARRVALNAQRILLGEEAATLPVEFARDEEMTINMATARTIGVYPPWAVMTEATMINEDRQDVARQESLEIVMRDAIEANYELAVRRQVVEAGSKEIPLARSVLFPQADLVATGLIVDGSRAAASFGSQPQRSIRGGVSATQLLYNEPSWANLSIQGSIQEAREYALETLGLDIALEAAVAYLTVLRAKTFESIQRTDLDRRRSNLELARVRVTLGSANPGEVFRWDAEVAAGRGDVITANALRNLTEIELNRILRRPLEESFGTAEAEIADSPLIGGTPNISDYMANPSNFRVFRSFMVDEALVASPELREIDAAIDAQERLLSSQRNSYWAPTLALFGDLDYRLAAGGLGSTPGAGLPAGSVPVNDDLDWAVGLSFSFPLLVGGARPTEVGRVSAELEALRLQRADLAQRIEQRVRSGLHEAGASYANIQLAADAATAAQRSFDLVTDSYSRGVANLVDLIDAQNTSLVADFGAATAVYDALIDFMQVERSVGRFQMFAGADVRQDFFDRLDSYFDAAGVRR